MSNSDLPLRVLHLNTEGTFRGGEQQVLYLLRYLAEWGVENFLACLPDSPLARRARGLPVQLLPYPHTREFSPGGWHSLRRMVREHRVNIVHAHNAATASAAGLMRLLAPSVGVVLSRRVDFSLRKNPLRLLKYYYLPHRVIAISVGIKRILVGDGIPPSRIEVIHSGIEVERFDALPGQLREELGLPAETLLVGTLAAFVRHKGFDVLLEAVERVGRVFPGAHFVWAGEGELEENLRAEAAQRGLRNLTFLGFRDDVVNLLRSLDVFVLASREEGLCTSLLDAMACRLPLVATRVGGIPEAVLHGQNGLLVPPGDPEALAETLLTMLRDPELRRSAGEAGRRRVEEFYHARETARKTLEVYRALPTTPNRERQP
jgi:L-malate glycosyltransferase